MKKTTRILGVIILLLLGLRYLTPYGYLFKGIRGSYLTGHTSAHIYDRDIFDQREMPTLHPQELTVSSESVSLDEQGRKALEDRQSTGLVVLKGGDVILEEYWEDHTATTLSNSFSTAKTVITLLTQIAVQDGYIDSWDDPITKYIPEYEIPEGVSVPTLRHFSTMTAGMQIEENYKDPFNKTAALYYSDDVMSTALSIPVGKFEAGTQWEYQSSCTQILTIALSKAVGESISSFANRELFNKVGFETSSTWHLDREGGLELGYCCLNAATRDFAKLGQLVLDHGSVDGHQIIDSAFVAAAVQGYRSEYYGHSFWVYPDSNGEVYGFRGLHGQDVMIFPKYDVVVTRTGHSAGARWVNDFRELEKDIIAQVERWF